MLLCKIFNYPKHFQLRLRSIDKLDGVPSLQDSSVLNLKKCLFTHNIFDCLKIADVLNQRDLMRQCIEFIQLNYNLLKDSDDFNEIPQEIKQKIIRDKDLLIIKIDLN